MDFYTETDYNIYLILEQLTTENNIKKRQNAEEKIKKFAEENRPDFNSLYYLTLEEIRVFYHKIMGYPSINATEATKVYTNKMYRQKYFKDDIPEQPFTKAYLRALNDMTVTKTAEGKREKLEKLEYVFYLAKQGLNLIESDYRIPVRTRNR